MPVPFDDGQFPEAVLDEPVFQGMEADDGDDSSGFKDLVEVLKEGFEIIELMVGLDAKGLEDLLCRMALLGKNLSRFCAFDDVNELEGGFDFLLRSIFHDSLCDSIGILVFAIFAEDSGEVL